MCRSVPPNSKEILNTYTKLGFRVIAFASKDFEFNAEAERNLVESDLIFDGFLIMENKIKKVSAKIIKELKDCEIETIMATGDNLLTAVQIAKECQIIEDEKVWTAISKDEWQNGTDIRKEPWNSKEKFSLGITGEILEKTNRNLREILEYTKVYARMSPE